MSLLGSKATVSSLSKETGSVLSVFRQTVDKLTDINSRAAKAYEEKQQHITQLKDESESLRKLTNDNDRVIRNIQSLLSN